MIPSGFDIGSWPVILAGGGGLALTFVIVLRPRIFWQLVIATSILSPAIMFGGYALLDEFLLGCIVLGGMLVVVVRRSTSNLDSRERVHKWLFLVMATYMLIESVRGLLGLDDWRMARWLLYYAMFAALGLICGKEYFPLPSRRSAAVTIAGSAAAYLALYIGYGAYAESVRGISRWELQGVEWAGTTVATMPLVVALPAALALVDEQRPALRRLGRLVIVLGIVTAAYYDSRISWISIIVLTVLAARRLRVTDVGVIACAFLLTFTLLLLSEEHDLPEGLGRFSATLLEAATAMWTPTEHDLDRQAFMIVAAETVMQDIGTFLFGVGTYVHRYAMAPLFREYAHRLTPQYNPEAGVLDVVRPAAFGGILVDSGIIGILLLLGNFAATGRTIGTSARRGARQGILCLATLVLLLLWSFVGQVQDVTLFYLSIMPRGLLAQLAQAPIAEARADVRLRRAERAGATGHAV